MFLFQLKKPDLIFFILIVVIIAVAVLIYFLIPIIKRKTYAEARENLKKREATFKANLEKLNSTKIDDQTKTED